LAGGRAGGHRSAIQDCSRGMSYKLTTNLVRISQPRVAWGVIAPPHLRPSEALVENAMSAVANIPLRLVPPGAASPGRERPQGGYRSPHTGRRVAEYHPANISDSRHHVWDRTRHLQICVLPKPCLVATLLIDPFTLACKDNWTKVQRFTGLEVIAV
jgi:hypothetical protein